MLLGGWRSFSMVLRYAHLAPDHLAVAAGKIRLKRRTKTGTSKTPARRMHVSGRASHLDGVVYVRPRGVDGDQLRGCQ